MKATSILLISLLLVACGGGGDDDSKSEPLPAWCASTWVGPLTPAQKAECQK